MASTNNFQACSLILLGAFLLLFCCCGNIVKQMIDSTFDSTSYQQPSAVNDKIIINKASVGKVLDAADKSKRQPCSVNLWHPINDCQDQRWYLRDIPGEGHFVIVDRVSNLVLDANVQQLRTNGCPVSLSYVNNGFNQQWRSVQAGQYIKIINRASGKILMAYSEDVFKNGCKIQLWEDTNDDAALWKMQ